MTVEGRLETLDAEIARLTDRSRRFTALRLIAFLVFIAGLFGAFESPWSPVFIALPALVVFVVALFRHGAVLDRQRIEELGVCRTAAAAAEIAGRVDDAAAEMPVPDAVDDHSPGEGMRGVDNPLGERDSPRALGKDLVTEAPRYGVHARRHAGPRPLRDGSRLGGGAGARGGVVPRPAPARAPAGRRPR